MELCVLIPKEFNLSRSSDSSYFVSARQTIEKDTKFTCIEGDFRLGKIEEDEEELPDCLPEGLKNIITFDFVISDRRHCNWIRFLSGSSKLDNQVNLVCTFNENNFIFKTTKSIEPNARIVVYFDLNSLDYESLSGQAINGSPFLENPELHKKLIQASQFTLFGDDVKPEETSNGRNSKIANKTMNSQTKRTFDEDGLRNGSREKLKSIESTNHGTEPYYSEQSDEEANSLNGGVVLGRADNLSENNLSENLSTKQDQPLSGSEADSPMDLVKRSDSYENLTDSNDEATNPGSIEVEIDLDSSKNLPITPSSTVLNSSQSSQANSCSNSHETALLKSANSSSTVKPVANQQANQQNGRRPHPFSYHRNKTCNLRSASMLPCDICNKCFDRPSLLRRHLRTHTGERPHVCDICKKAFSTSSSLNTHRRIHTGERPHVCPVCNKKFTASSNLYYHRMTHTKDKPHKCALCDKSFPTPGDLKSHAYIHNGNWPFKCSQCGKGFSKQNTLKTHLFLHSGEKPNICKICGKAFALESNLRAHYKTHQNNLLQVNSNKTIESLIMKGKATQSNYKSLAKAQQAVRPASLSERLNAASLSGSLLPATPAAEPKLNSLLGGTGLLATLNNLDSFKHLFSQTDSSKELNRHSTPISNSNLFSSLLNSALNQGNNSGSFNQQTNQLNNQLNCQLNGSIAAADQLMPTILNSLTNGSSAISLPLTPTDSPTCSSSPSLPWMNNSLKAATANTFNKTNSSSSSRSNCAKGKASSVIDLFQGAKNDQSIKSLKDDLQNLTGSLLMANNLIPQICPNNGVDQSSLQQQLNNFLMATTAAQLLSLKYK